MTEHIYQPGARGDAERQTAAEAALDAWAEARVRDFEREDAERLEDAKFHTVNVTTTLDDEGTEDERRRVDDVRFACTASEDADCRTYPDCDCEAWFWNEDRTTDEAGHVRTPGHECWLAPWFENEGHSYAGEDADDARDDMVPAVDRSGHITVTFFDEWIEWKFVDAAEVAA